VLIYHVPLPSRQILKFRFQALVTNKHKIVQLVILMIKSKALEKILKEVGLVFGFGFFFKILKQIKVLEQNFKILKSSGSLKLQKILISRKTAKKLFP